MSQPVLFPTTVVGSMPRPLFVKELFDEFHEGKVSDAERQRLLDESVPLAIALQETAGVDIVSDGEWRRFSYVGVISDVASGFTRGLSGEKRDGKYWHTVTGEVTPGNAGILADHARFAIAHSRRPVKVALPSPYLLSVRMWDETVSKNVYPTREDFARAIVPILRAQVEALAAAGVHTVQLDDPHLCLFVDPEVRKTFADADREAMHCASLINEVFAGMTGIVKAVHLCRRNKGRQGWIGEGSYDRIMGPLCALDVDQLMMEFTIPAAGDMRCLRDLPTHFRIGLGCVDCRGEVIDTPETIIGRVEKAMEHVAKERLVLAPDCGFAPGNAADIPLDEAYAKLRNMVKAAEVLRERYA
ncbi:cobalamin-independent methionine synthase II family protein [Pendulispora rubella]|uniref:Cobalamin-independent methionine synthase II family protein n=1 Tax=Pendulispora rubella TaxID=2741070 RepID=A0ABZ2KTS5_9BACT